jgi:UDP-N-acetylglucosamine diphosphorylase/glucosamine-1-phosphate N-acetyltransferase
MHYLLFDDALRTAFLPLAFTRPICDLRFGVSTIREKWMHVLTSPVGALTESYLQEALPSTQGPIIYINARFSPSQALINAIHALDNEQGLNKEGQLIAYRSQRELSREELTSKLSSNGLEEWQDDILEVRQLPDLFQLNHLALAQDYQLLTQGKKSAPLPEHCTLIGDPEKLFIHPSAKVYASTFNVNDGPIYIDENSEVMEGCHVRGPFSLSNSATLKMGAKIYGATSIGPHCKVGGEVGNSILLGYSNKGHDGYMGNSIIGEWCNLGADTNTSNLKNNYSQIKTWSYAKDEYTNSGLTFCGLMMGDYSKCGINTMFNTGTTVGVNANIYGGDFPSKFIPSFSWGSADGFVEYQMEAAFDTAEKVCARRKVSFDDKKRSILGHIFSITQKYRGKK